MQLQANYVDIKMIPTANQLSVSISMVYRGTGNPPNVTGLDIGNVGEATCKVTLPAAKGTYKTIPMTDTTPFKLASQYRNISCKRLPSNTDANGVVSYLPVRFTVKTDSGDFITDMPPVGQAPLASINETVNAAITPIQTSLNQTTANNQTAIAQVKADTQSLVNQARTDNQVAITQLQTVLDKTALDCIYVSAAGNDVSCPAGYKVTGCTAGSNLGSNNPINEQTACHTHSPADWTGAYCCRVSK